MKRAGHKYIDCESGLTLDAWFPERLPCKRRCLAQKVGVIRGEHFEIEIDINRASKQYRGCLFKIAFAFPMPLFAK